MSESRWADRAFATGADRAAKGEGRHGSGSECRSVKDNARSSRWRLLAGIMIYLAMLLAIHEAFFRADLSESDRKLVVGRAKSFWDQRVAGEQRETHRFLAGPLLDDHPDARVWAALQGQIDYLDYDIRSVRPERRNRVRLTVRYRWRPRGEEFASLEPRETLAGETWQRIGGEWMRVGILDGAD